MDIQLKKGLVEVCVLAVLRSKSSYGYKIITDISDVIEISESTLYPILRRLETSDCLETYTQFFNGRQRRYYRITNKGIDKIDNFMNEWAEMDIIYSFIKSKGVGENEKKRVY